MASFVTLSGPVRFEIDKIKGSRFLGFAQPVSTEDEALRALGALKEEFRDARHHCYAWRLGLGPDRFRYNDDGEPRGTAGPPILKQIDGRDLKDVFVCVVRYFGGTKLGTGGLAKAYSLAAKSVLECGEVVEVVLTAKVHLTFDYPLSGQVSAVVAAHRQTPAKEAFGARVEQWFDVPIEAAEAFALALIERTAGQAEVSTEYPDI